MMVRFMVVRELKADVICPEERGAKRIHNQLSLWHTLPPEALRRSFFSN